MKNEIAEKRSQVKEGSFFNRNRKILIAAIIIVLLGTIGALIVSPILDEREDQAWRLAEKIERAYDDYKAGINETETAELLEDLNLLLNEGIIDYKGTYASQRAYLVKAQLNIENEEWVSAAENFMVVADEYSNSYIAATSLFSAASLYEESGDNDSAISALQTLVSDYKAISPDIAHAYFNLGRLFEAINETEKALEMYETITVDYSDSDWKNLAKTRIITLK